MNKLDSMSAAVKEVIDAYPAGHEFYGNQLKDDVVKVYPEAADMYPDTILRMARRHRRYAFCVVSQNDSLYKKLAVIPIVEQVKVAAPMPEPPIIHYPCVQTVQGLLFSFLLLALVSFAAISYNTAKNTETTFQPDSGNRENFQNSAIFFENRLSLPQIRHEYLSMPERVNIRQPGKPATERHSIEAKGVLYESKQEASGHRRS
jgi:hypothetical protein